MPSVRAWILVGVSVRALLLVLGHPVELHADEAHYAWLGMAWERFDFLTDSQRFLWPPAYPFLHRVGFTCFEEHGVLSVRILQVIASASTGWGVSALARRLIHDRAAPWATAIWALHLPLAGFCALGWPEPLFLSLFLPSLVFLHDAADELDTRRLITSGLLLGVAALFKELAIGLALLLAAWLAVRTFRARPSLTASATLTFLLAVFLPLAPWTARNLSHYSSPILSGSTLGENIYQGWNARDLHFDLRPVVRRAALDPPPDVGPAPVLRPSTDSVWPRPGGTNLSSRQAAKLRSGATWVLSNPADYLRTRVTRFAHMSAPLSFPVRHLALGHYGGPLGHGLLARSFLILATLQSVLLLLLGGIALARHAPPHALIWLPAGALLAQPMLVGMTRLRVPLLPFFMCALAAWIVGARPPRTRFSGFLAAALISLLLVADRRSILWFLQYAWGITA